ncbi:hypothetical protein ALC56_08385 [Trachymyrmex septentrionalis]|uniref:Uncharacterized protein n=1 Tax=Trachymyrmex septentrionalis TaxID=34720 RepID=A0A195FAU0_9HYME|nr:hypothetical protein ALC56_08385 [Trachymyrmex septentrionalis]
MPGPLIRSSRERDLGINLNLRKLHLPLRVDGTQKRGELTYLVAHLPSDPLVLVDPRSHLALVLLHRKRGGMVEQLESFTLPILLH